MVNEIIHGFSGTRKVRLGTLCPHQFTQSHRDVIEGVANAELRVDIDVLAAFLERLIRVNHWTSP